MKILHITDLHYSEDERKILVQQEIIQKLIQESTKHGTIDFLFFTGDLVNRGDKPSDFIKAKELLIDELCDKLQIPIERVMFVPGNHDVYRKQELDDVNEAIAKIENNEGIDEYVTKNNKASLFASLKNLENYNEFIKKTVFDKTEDTFCDGLFGTHIREHDGAKIGITTLNSAWRCIDSKTDYGNLKYPIHYLRKAIDEIKECDFKIILMHHPLSEFIYWNAHQLEDLIHREYHMLFTGHKHRESDTIHINEGIGIYHCSAGASLSFEKDSKLGFTLVKTNLESYKLEICNVKYNRENEKFEAGLCIPAEIPVDGVKRELNKLRETLKKRFIEHSAEADKLFLSYQQQQGENNFLKLFTDPIIKNRPKQSEKAGTNFKLDQLIANNDNHLLLGRDKTGKSTILYKIFLDLLRGFSVNKMIPLYIDCRVFTKSGQKLNIKDKLYIFLEVSRAKVQELLGKYKLVLLLDNFDPDNKLLVDPLVEFQIEFSNSQIVATASETLYSNVKINIGETLGFQELYIHDITRTEIRALTEKWPNLDAERKKAILEKIHGLFKQLNMPANYWTVSLFIWIFEKNSNANVFSNFQIIQYYIDNLLDKEGFDKSGQYKIDYEDLRSFLADLAFYLVEKHGNSLYRIDYAELVSFTNEYKKRNVKFVINVETVVNLILEKGILKKDSTDHYTFRLNGVFEYFLGFFMSFNDEFRNKLIDDDHLYLSFKNEFEICAGFIPHDVVFVKKIYDRTTSIYKKISQKYNTTALDTELIRKIDEGYNISMELTKALKENIKEPISHEEQDELMESAIPSTDEMSEVQEKKFYQSIEMNVDTYEDSLFILGRVFRNSKLRNQNALNDEIFGFILDSSCLLGMAIVDDIEASEKDESYENSSDIELLKIIVKVIPIVVQSYFFEIAIQTNLEALILEKIKQLKKDKRENQFKLLILYFSLIDLDLKSNEKYISEIIDLLEIPLLKQSSLIKLYVYLSLKVNGNRNLQSKIEHHIREQETSFNNDNSDQRRGEIDYKISSAKKENMLNLKTDRI